MKLNFIATDKQALDIKNNEYVTFIELLDKQPPEGYDCSALVDNMVCFYQNLQIGNNGINIPLRHKSGKYPVKESWDILPWDSTQWPEDFKDLPPGVDRYYYKSLGDISPHGRWNSPASMPAEAVRWELDLKVSVKRVQEVREDILFRTYDNSTGNPFQDGRDAMSFPDEWNALHAKSRKTKDGKGYESFPYDKESGKYCIGREFTNFEFTTYKGLPLTLNYNPFAVIMDGKVRKI